MKIAVLLFDNYETLDDKIAFTWVTSINEKMEWLSKARWVVDDRYYTSSGMTAGMDMALGFLADRHGTAFARKVAHTIEHVWIQDKDNDFFVAQ